MKPISCFRLLASTAFCLSLVFPASRTLAQEAATKEVEVGKITLTVPETWRATKPASRLRLAQFDIPPVMGDKEETELAVFSFSGGGGSVDANLERWIKQFETDGREIELTQGESPLGKYYFADIKGTYNKPVGPPIRRQTKPLQNARMYGMILKTDDGIYYLKMAGPRYTVSAQSAALRKAIGATQGDEAKYELGMNDKKD